MHVLGEGDVDTEVMDPDHAVLKLNSGKRGPGRVFIWNTKHVVSCGHARVRESVSLAGHTIPVVGLGVYLCEPGPQAYEAVLSALRLGYRHIDTAQVYGNESDVGR